MKSIDLKLSPPSFQKDPAATSQMAAYTAKLEEILSFLVDNIQAVKVVDAAPTAEELTTLGDGRGNTMSEINILDHSTQSSRRIYYKNSAGTLRYLESD